MSAEATKGIRITTILGTTRPGNYTSKALALVIDELKQKPDVSVTVIDPAKLNLSFPGLDSGSSGTAEIQAAVKSATGVILATPEYHGSFAAAMKLVIENLGFPSVLAGKPTALLGVAAGQIGAVKSLEQLRGVCSHVGAIVLPGPVSVPGVQGLFDEEGNCRDPKIEKRIRGVATHLLDYINLNICPRMALEQMVRSE